MIVVRGQNRTAPPQIDGMVMGKDSGTGTEPSVFPLSELEASARGTFGLYSPESFDVARESSWFLDFRCSAASLIKYACR